MRDPKALLDFAASCLQWDASYAILRFFSPCHHSVEPLTSFSRLAQRDSGINDIENLYVSVCGTHRGCLRIKSRETEERVRDVMKVDLCILVRKVSTIFSKIAQRLRDQSASITCILESLVELPD